MSSKRVRNLLRFGKLGRAKSQSTTDLTEWSKSDEKLLKAVEGNDVKKVSHILSKKAMVPSKLGPRGHSVFHVACAIGNPNIVELLLKETDDVNVLTIQGNTCLQLAAAKGHEQVMQLLMQSEADANKRDSNDMTALHHACAGLHGRCVNLLLHFNADHRVTDKGGKTALFFAAHRGDKGICELLVSRGAEVNANDKMQITPLMIAAKEGNRDVCEFLLRRGANPKAVDRDGHTALDYANAGNHGDLEEVFAKAPTHASWVLNNTESGANNTAPSPGDSDSSKPGPEVASPSPVQEENVVTIVTPIQTAPASPQPSDNASEEESPSLPRSPAVHAKPAQQVSLLNSKDTQPYKELEAEHEQLTEDYHTLSIENLKLRDKLEFVQKRMNDKHEKEKAAMVGPQEVQNEVRMLKNLLDEEKGRYKELEARFTKLAEGADVSAEEGTKDSDSWHDSEDEELFHPEGKHAKGRDMNDRQMLALLRSQILTLQQENDQLRNSVQIIQNGHCETSEDGNGADKTDSNQSITALKSEKQQMKDELRKLREAAMTQELNGALGEEQLILANAKLQEEVETLNLTLYQLEAEKTTLQLTVIRLEQEKDLLPSDKMAVLNSAKVMEDVVFDEEGFVEGQDLTKEEFLQAQNEQLKMQCGLLTEELTKLRTTFDAILKAGDNLQADYDQLHSEKQALHEQLLKVAQEKEEVVKENEFLLSDGNALHDDLKKLVSELEKMQDKYHKVCEENKQLTEQRDSLQREQSAITIAGKVGEVARLLEEREKLQTRLAASEESVKRLSHDQAILLEEVQSQQDRIATLTAERDALQAEVEETETLMTQHEALTQDYTQLEEDFNELLQEKECLETSLRAAVENPSSPGAQQSQEIDAVLEDRVMLLSQREQLEITVQELSQENAQLEELVEVMRTHLAEDKEEKGDEEDEEATIRQLEITITELSKENASLEDDLTAAREVIVHLESRLVAQAMGDVSTPVSEINRLRASIAQLEDTVTELAQDNVEMEEELIRDREVLLSSQQAQESSSADLSTLKEEKQALLSKVTELEKRLSQVGVNGGLNHVQSLPSSSVNNTTILKEGDLVSQLREENCQLKKDLSALRSRLTGRSNLLVNGMLEDTMDSRVGRESEEIAFLKEQVAKLQQRLVELEKNHSDIVNTYRIHLLSAVQGHIDPDVKEALHNIIEMRSMEQFC